jgi:hypothetical protein
MSNKGFSKDKGEKMSKVKKSLLKVFTFGFVFSGLLLQASAQRSNQLAGTYQLDSSKSENVSEIVNSTARNNQMSAAQKEELEDKLEAPGKISITIRGNEITMSNSLSSPVTFVADGRTQNAGGSRIRATMRGDEIRISNVGNGTDYMVTFTSLNNGQNMRVTRMVTTSYLNQTVFADSYYTKTGTNVSINDSTNDDGYSTSDSNDGGYSDTTTTTTNYPDDNRNYPQTTTRSGNFYIPNGVVLSGTLENPITTEASQENDKFRLRIDSPNEYQGAIIEGYLTGVKRSGKISGSSKLTFNFETIRLRNGQNYDFAGVLQSVTDAQGKTVKVNNEGQIEGKSQTKKTVKRGGIGAGLGAIIGGIIGGGKGAVIGATIGGSAGAGSVAIEDKDDVDLQEGSIISVQSTSPKR